MSDPLDLEHLKELHSKVDGFDFQASEGGWSGDRLRLAELGADGKWKYWDLHTSLSREACEFIVAAHEQLPTLVQRLEAAERERDRLNALLGDALKALSIAEHALSDIAWGDGSYDDMMTIVRDARSQLRRLPESVEGGDNEERGETT